MRMPNPVHPGRFLRTEIIEAHNLSVTEAAKVLGVSRPTLSSLLNAKADLSGDMALRFEKAFGVDMEALMRIQNSYEHSANTPPFEDDPRRSVPAAYGRVRPSSRVLGSRP